MRQPPHHFDVTILPYTMQRIEKTGRKQAEMDPHAVLDHPEVRDGLGLESLLSAIERA